MSDESRPVLVDTSVWIELLRHSAHPLRPFLEQMIAEDRARLCSAVVAELLQGATTPKDAAAAEALGKAIPLLQSDDSTWLEAGRLGQRLRMKGVGVGLLDCYIAALATTHGCAILSLDKHFPLMAKHSDLDLISIP
jgi:predicted nucleic acid-binding protein